MCRKGTKQSSKRPSALELELGSEENLPGLVQPSISKRRLKPLGWSFVVCAAQDDNVRLPSCPSSGFGTHLSFIVFPFFDEYLAYALSDHNLWFPVKPVRRDRSREVV